MMRVATSLVIVALLTAAATAARMNRQQEGNYSCIETFIDLEESLIKRNSNIDRLHNAFFPSNQRVPVAVDLVVHFSTSLQTNSHKLCYPSTARLDNQTADYKFRWSASAMLLFVPPEMLRPLSLCLPGDCHYSRGCNWPSVWKSRQWRSGNGGEDLYKEYQWGETWTAPEHTVHSREYAKLMLLYMSAFHAHANFLWCIEIQARLFCLCMLAKKNNQK